MTGHLDTGAEIWVILNEEQTWGQICSEDEEAPVQFISMEDAAEVKYSEEAEEEAEEEEEAETEEPAEDEAGKMTAAGCTKIIVTAEEGADLYAEPDREAEVTGHLDAETEVWVSLNEEQTWGQLYNEDEEAAPQFISMEDAVTAETVYEEQMNGLGYRKVQVLNQNGTDIYDSPEEEASVIDHAEFESELWIRDFEAEGWAEVYTEEEIQKYVMLDEIGEQMPFDEEMLEAGYIKAYVAVDIGANVYGSIDGDDIVNHLDAGTELWVKLIDDADRALIFNMDEEAPATYINLVDIIATKKPEDMEDLPTREIVIHDVLKEFGMNVIFIGTEVPLEAELINFSEDDQYTVKWQYSENGKKFIDIPDANELTFTYVADKDNQDYIWKIVVSLVSAEE